MTGSDPDAWTRYGWSCPQMLAHDRYSDPGEPRPAVTERAPDRRSTARISEAVATLDHRVRGRASRSWPVAWPSPPSTRMPLTWDGAWFLLRSADSGTPTFLHRRAIHALLEAPAMVAAWVSGDVSTASFVFSAAYVAVPALAVLAAWRVVRDVRPALIVWPILGICLVELPGLMFFLSESAMVAELVWPLVLAAALGRLGRHRVLVVTLVLLIAMAHPFGGPALAGVGIVAWVARRGRANADPAWAGWAFVVVGVALAVSCSPFVHRTRSRRRPSASSRRSSAPRSPTGRWPHRSRRG